MVASSSVKDGQRCSSARRYAKACSMIAPASMERKPTSTERTQHWRIFRLNLRWSGPIDRTYDGLPIVSRLGGFPHIVFGVGWSGNGVGPSRIGGRILASLVTGIKDRWTTNKFVGRPGRTFPPEPLRYIVGSTVRNAVLRKDVAEIGGQDPGWIDRALASLAPAGTEDKRKGARSRAEDSWLSGSTILGG